MYIFPAFARIYAYPDLCVSRLLSFFYQKNLVMHLYFVKYSQLICYGQIDAFLYIAEDGKINCF